MFGFGKKEYKYMATMKIEGMMCAHCEAHVQEKLREIDGVKVVKASHSKGTAIIKSNEPLDENELKNAVTSSGYAVLDVDFICQ